MRRIQWQKIKLDTSAFESAGVFDVNRDGIPDIVCGDSWYEGPTWKKHRVGEVMAVDEYFDDFSTIEMDVNGDGWPDFITGGWWGGTLRWRENPRGPDKEWPTHDIDACGNIETTRAWDVDGDGYPEIVPNTPGAPLAFYRLLRDAAGKGVSEFSKHVVSEEPTGHGLGFGDITGDGRGCLVVHSGWWEPGPDPLKDSWTFHPEFELDGASVPILVADVNEDGVNELVVGQAHGYGLDYYTQSRDGAGRKWTRHPIDPFFSQYHELHWIDIDGDGRCELITGNRYRAHCGKEAGETDEVGLFCFKWNGESFTKQIIDYGRAPDASGTGIFMAIVDIDGDGRPDIVAPGKEGLYIFFNRGPERIGDEETQH